MIVILEVGEIMQNGDEWYDDASGQGGGEKGWNPVVVMVGLPVSEGMIVRRRQKSKSKYKKLSVKPAGSPSRR